MSDALSAREQDLNIQREHLASEFEAARRAAEEAAAERIQLQQRGALLDAEREQFRGWMRDAREEAARSIKVRAIRPGTMHTDDLLSWLLFTLLHDC